MTCEASGYPAATLSWTKGGFPLEGHMTNKVEIQKNGALVIVRRVESRHEGEYVCRAVNEVGSARKHYIVTVLGCHSIFLIVCFHK